MPVDLYESLSNHKHKGQFTDEGENFQKIFGLLVHDCYIDDCRSRHELAVYEHG